MLAEEAVAHHPELLHLVAMEVAVPEVQVLRGQAGSLTRVAVAAEQEQAAQVPALTAVPAVQVS
jgi:hypothetical protein